MRVPVPAVILAAGLCLGAGLATAARAQAPNIVEGRALARQWCSSCHQVEPGGVMTDAAPSFASLANDPDLTPERLRGWLFDPHPPMPDFNLTYHEIRAIEAYLESLKQ
ncbi:MAG: cytochrome c [Rhodospirillaceae bacterium]|nr:cytochrome c [Rhodospirillaceae bacterium]